MMEKFTTKRMSLLTGRTHPALAEEVAANLGIELGNPGLTQFAPRMKDQSTSILLVAPDPLTSRRSGRCWS